MTKPPRPRTATARRILKTTCRHERTIELYDGCQVCTTCERVLKAEAA